MHLLPRAGLPTGHHSMCTQHLQGVPHSSPPIHLYYAVGGGEGCEREGQGRYLWVLCWPTYSSPPFPFQSCLQRSFKAEVFSCPNCRHTLQTDLAMRVNTKLQQILINLFPGYEAGR